MKRLVNFIVAAALSVGAFVTALEPAAAMPMPSPTVSSASDTTAKPGVIQVRYDRHHHNRHHWHHDRRGYRHHGHHWRHHRHHWRHHHYRHHRHHHYYRA